MLRLLSEKGDVRYVFYENNCVVVQKFENDFGTIRFQKYDDDGDDVGSCDKIEVMAYWSRIYRTNKKPQQHEINLSLSLCKVLHFNGKSCNAVKTN